MKTFYPFYSLLFLRGQVIEQDQEAPAKVDTSYWHKEIVFLIA
jgi:hypothetical protein